MPPRAGRPERATISPGRRASSPAARGRPTTNGGLEPASRVSGRQRDKTPPLPEGFYIASGFGLGGLRRGALSAFPKAKAGEAKTKQSQSGGLGNALTRRIGASEEELFAAVGGVVIG